MDPARENEAKLPSHPIDGSGAKTTDVVLQPNGSTDLRGDPAAYFLVPIDLTKEGKDVQRRDVTPERRFRQEFAVDFTVNLELDAVGARRQVVKTLPTTLTVFVREKR